MLAISSSALGPGDVGQHPVSAAGRLRRVLREQVGEEWPGRGEQLPGIVPSLATPAYHCGREVCLV